MPCFWYAFFRNAAKQSTEEADEAEKEQTETKYTKRDKL
jgi:hypothetical protein